MPEDFEEDPDPENLKEPPSFFPLESGAPDSRERNQGRLIEVKVEGVFAHELAGKISHFVLLTDGERRLPIVIGPFEALSIQHVVEGLQPDRPMTHDLVRSIIEKLDITLVRIAIDDYWSNTYYAKLYLRQGKSSEEIEIDSRPSDAIALAMRFEASIFVAEGVLDANAQ